MLPRALLAAGLIIVGFIFIGQGLGYLGGSGMTNEPIWAVVGAVMVVAAVVLAWQARRLS